MHAQTRNVPRRSVLGRIQYVTARERDLRCIHLRQYRLEREPCRGSGTSMGNPPVEHALQFRRDKRNRIWLSDNPDTKGSDDVQTPNESVLAVRRGHDLVAPDGIVGPIRDGTGIRSPIHEGRGNSCRRVSTID